MSHTKKWKVMRGKVASNAENLKKLVSFEKLENIWEKYFCGQNTCQFWPLSKIGNFELMFGSNELILFQIHLTWNGITVLDHIVIHTSLAHRFSIYFELFKFPFSILNMWRNHLHLFSIQSVSSWICSIYHHIINTCSLYSKTEMYT